jgi:hypothetical protein
MITSLREELLHEAKRARLCYREFRKDRVYQSYWWGVFHGVAFAWRLLRRVG